MRTCVIVDGNLPSLVACFAARERVLAAGQDLAAIQPIALVPTFEGPTAAARTRAAEYQAELNGMRVMRCAVKADGPAGESGLLLTASFLASKEGCDLLEWPVQRATGDVVDIDAAGRDADRCLLVTRLVAMDTLRPHFKADCSFVDLSDRQLCDLALDMDLPVNTCWWWKEQFVSRVLERNEREIPKALSGDDLAVAQFRECIRFVPMLKEVRFLASSL